ncbi:MAG: hypothetical protein V4604_05085 [Bacteroidota bacterium]
MANKRISELTSASALTLTDLLALVNDAQTKKVTLSTLLSFIAAQDQFATLDSGGKIPVTQLPDSITGSLHYQATWDADLNLPAIPTAVAGNLGWYYVVGTEGNTSVNGISDWKVGDWLISNGEAWQKIDNTDSVLSWNSRSGAVMPESGDYDTDEVTEAGNKYFTEARVLAVLLASLSVPSSPVAAVTSSDSVLTAMGKVQGQLNDRELKSQKGTAGGYPELDGSGKIPTSQLPASVLGAASYQGAWNGTGSSPATGNASGNKGWYYVVSTNNTTNVDGINEWKVGDWVISNGTVWQKVDNTDAISSWNGRTGAVIPMSNDYTTSQVSEEANQYFTTARVLATTLAGLSVTSGPGVTTITSAHSVLAGMGRLQGQINDREVAANKGAASGYASLDSGTRVPKAQLPKGQVSLGLDFTSSSLTLPSNTTTETILFSKQIAAGTLAAGDQLNLSAWIGVTNGGTNSKTFKIYFHTSNSTGGTLVGSYKTTSATISLRLSREFSLISNTTMKAGTAASTFSLDGQDMASLDSAITIPSVSAGFWVIITGARPVSNTDTVRLDRVALTAFLQ